MALSMGSRLSAQIKNAKKAAETREKMKRANTLLAKKRRKQYAKPSMTIEELKE